jgi:hypothetical protein
MRFYVTWFQAPVEDAAEIFSVARTREWGKWPHLALPGVDGPDMNVLEKLARSRRPRGSPRIGGELLRRGKLTDTPFIAVSRLNGELIRLLAATDESKAEALGLAWASALEGVEAPLAVELVSQVAEFSKRAERAGVAVLERVVM